MCEHPGGAPQGSLSDPVPFNLFSSQIINIKAPREYSSKLNDKVEKILERDEDRRPRLPWLVKFNKTKCKGIYLNFFKRPTKA